MYGVCAGNVWDVSVFVSVSECKVQLCAYVYCDCVTMCVCVQYVMCNVSSGILMIIDAY